MKKFHLFLVLMVFISSQLHAAVQVTESDFSKSHITGAALAADSEQRLVYFWASWCPDCRGKLRGDLVKFVKERPGLELVTVNLDRDFKKGKRFLDEEKLKFSVIRDDDKIFRKRFDVYAVPGWALLKKTGANWELVESATGSDMEKISKSYQITKGEKQ